MEKIHTCEHFFDKIYNSGRFQRTCKYVTSVLKNPFQIFMEFSEFAVKYETSKLDDLTRVIYDYFSCLDGIDKSKLRDMLVIDRLTTNRSGHIPDFLRIHSPLVKQILKSLDKNEGTKRKEGIKRSLSLLSNMKKFVYVDYDIPNPVSKQFKLYENDIDNI